MRSPAYLLAALAVTLAACRDGRDPPPVDPGPPADELPHAEVELLVQRFAAGQGFSWLTMAPDGTRVEPFTGIGPEVVAAYPSPDGRRIALVRDLDVDGHLWVMDRVTRGSTPLLTGARLVNAVAWSPDGTRLAVAQSTAQVVEDVFVMNADGSGEVDLTPDDLPAVYFDRDPAWSPDGTTIAFSSNRDGFTRLWLMDPDGANLRKPLAAVESRERMPVWSPDGAWLGFLSQTPGPGDTSVLGVGIVRPDGSGYRTFPVARPFTNLAWSPDGRLLYAGGVTLDWEVYALDPATGEIENLTRHLFQDVAARPLRWVAPPVWAGLAEPVTYHAEAAGSPGLAAGYLNADADLDLVALAPGLASVRILLGEGGGTFRPLGGLDTVEAPRHVAVADLDRDGYDDVLVGADGTLQRFAGSVEGPGLPETAQVDGDVRAIGLADFGLDVPVELATVVAPRHAAPFHAMLHGVNGEGAFIPLVDAPVVSGVAAGACVADFTGEGWPDLVVLRAGAGASTVIVPGLGPSFAEAFVAAEGLDLGADVVARCADLDGDRRDDLVLLSPGPAGGVSILLAGEGGCGAPSALAVAGADLALADLDRDGDADLVVAGEAGLVLARNRGDGTFAPPVALAAAAVARVLAADLDRDGWVDVAAVDAAGDVLVLRNRGAGG